MAGPPPVMSREAAQQLLSQFAKTGAVGADPGLAPSTAPGGSSAPGGAPPALLVTPPVTQAATAGSVSAPTTKSDPTSGQGVGPPGTGIQPDDVHQPGGEALFRFQHPDFQTIEELYRILPDDSWFQPTVSPSNPIQFEIGAFVVPNSQQYWLFDYEFSVYRFSGVDAGDFLKAEAGRYSGVMGFDVTINGRRPSHLLYQLDPQPVQLQKQSFTTFTPQGGTSSAAVFNRSTAQSFAATASQGTSTLPVRRGVQGAEGMPFTMVAREADRVALSIIIFKRVLTPIAAIEARHAGYLVQSLLAQNLTLRMRPR